jgi:hypothetical protein
MYIALALLYWILSGLFSGAFRVAEKVLKRNERAQTFSASVLAQRVLRLAGRKSTSTARTIPGTAAAPTPALAPVAAIAATATVPALHTEGAR